MMGFFARRLTTISIVYDFNNLGAARLARLDTFSVVNRATKSVFMGKSKQSPSTAPLSFSPPPPSFPPLSQSLSLFSPASSVLRVHLRPFPFLVSGTKREPWRGEPNDRKGPSGLTRG